MRPQAWLHGLYLTPSTLVAHQCPFAVRHCGDVLAVKLMVAKVLCAAIEVLEAESEVVHPIVQRRWCQRRRLAAERSLSSPLRHVQVAELVQGRLAFGDFASSSARIQ